LAFPGLQLEQVLDPETEFPELLLFEGIEREIL